MSTLDDRVRAALHDAVDGVPLHPDEHDVARRTAIHRRRRRTTRAAAVAAVSAVAIAGMALMNGAGVDEPSTATVAPSTTAVAVPATSRVAPTACTPPAALPFQPSFLPEGWRAGSYDPTAGFALWARTEASGSYSAVIEVSMGGRGDGVALREPIETITVLGQKARLADISDGYAVVVDLGATPCDRWILLAHPSATRAELRGVAEGLVAASPSAAPSTPSTTVAATVPTGYRIVARVGSALVEVSSTGERRQVTTLPDVPGVEPVLVASGHRLVVTYLGRTLLYDTTTWAPPVELGEYRTLGVASDRDGYWVADPSTSPPADGMVRWRRYGWDGVATGPVTQAFAYPLPIGALDGGVALWEKGTQRVVVSTESGTTDLGTAIPAAARGHLVAFATMTDEVRVHDLSTGTTRSIDLGSALNVDTAMSGALSADGRHLALLVNSERPAESAIVLVDLTDDTARVVRAGARILDWSADGRSLLILQGDAVLALDRASGTVTEFPLPPDTSPNVVVLDP